MRRPLRLLWLVALWLLLWRDPTVANVVSGVAVAVAVDAVLRLPRLDSDPRHGVRPVALLRFLVYFAWKLVEANVYLAREVVTPTNQIRTGIIAVPLSGCSPFVATVVANAITLTPGTLSLEVRDGDDPELYVHVLHLHDIERARGSVRRFTQLASDAFPLRSGEVVGP